MQNVPKVASSSFKGDDKTQDSRHECRDLCITDQDRNFYSWGTAASNYPNVCTGNGRTTKGLSDSRSITLYHSLRSIHGGVVVPKVVQTPTIAAFGERFQLSGFRRRIVWSITWKAHCVAKCSSHQHAKCSSARYRGTATKIQEQCSNIEGLRPPLESEYNRMPLPTFYSLTTREGPQEVPSAPIKALVRKARVRRTASSLCSTLWHCKR
jgi:hypothetical protein